MVQCMENWFMADKECLALFFGQGFNVNALPNNPNIEAILTTDIFNYPVFREREMRFSTVSTSRTRT